MNATAPRPAPLLPERGEGESALRFVVAVLAALACLSAVAALAGARAAALWRADLRASATVQVRAGPGETPGEAAARAAEALAGVRGVAEARALGRPEAEKLLEPWLGVGNVPPDLPLPQLVTVEFDPAAPATAHALEAALAAAHVDAGVDDHSRWLGDVQRAAGWLAAGALGACGLLLGAAAAAIAFATRAALSARREVVEVLHLSGARDRYVAGLFQRRFAWLAAQAGALGALAAAGAAVAARALGGEGGFTPALPLHYGDLLVLLPCPGLAAMAAAISARATAMAILRERP
jgi:cell division transport system permease protein